MKKHFPSRQAQKARQSQQAPKANELGRPKLPQTIQCRFPGFVTALSLALSLLLASAPSLAQNSAFSVEDDFARELKLVESLKIYNQQIKEQIAGQEQAKQDIEQSILSAKELEPQVGPLLEKMIDALDRFVDADLPFHLQERKVSVARLRDLLSESSIGASERFRQILDIYTVETEYGQTFEAYSDELNEQPVDVLRIGRLALYAQSKDQSQSYYFNKSSRQWEALDASANRNIRKAIKVAAKTIAPELLSLPVSPPSGN